MIFFLSQLSSQMAIEQFVPFERICPCPRENVAKSNFILSFRNGWKKRRTLPALCLHVLLHAVSFSPSLSLSLSLSLLFFFLSYLLYFLVQDFTLRFNVLSDIQSPQTGRKKACVVTFSIDHFLMALLLGFPVPPLVVQSITSILKDKWKQQKDQANWTMWHLCWLKALFFSSSFSLSSSSSSLSMQLSIKIHSLLAQHERFQSNAQTSLIILIFFLLRKLKFISENSYIYKKKLIKKHFFIQ